MRPFPPLLASLIVLSAPATMPAVAQVTLNLEAIDSPTAKPPANALPARAARPVAQPARPATATPPQTRPATPQTRPAASARPPATAAQPASRNRQRAPASALPVAAAAAAITLPANPPPTASLPPPAIAVAVPAPPARPVAVAGAGSSATTGAENMRISFLAGKSDLSAETITALEKFANAAPASDAITFNVVAYAAGNPEDPSTPRRLALARALAIRSALMADGIASARIYVRAQGAPVADATGTALADAPPDRVDITMLGRAAAAARAAIPSSGKP